jgi:cytochrome c553
LLIRILPAAALLSVLFWMPAAAADAPLLPPSGDPWATRAIPDGAPDGVRLRKGAGVYTFCASCHLADGGGRPDGAIPRLAGQRAEIVAAKLANIRSGHVFLPVMAAFANSLSPDEVTAVAAYIAALPQPKYIGHGAGDALPAGQQQYAASCAACHGANAEGNPALLAPRLCGQHAGYILRRVDEVVKGRRADANPGMAAVVAAVPVTGLTAAADFLSRGECR